MILGISAQGSDGYNIPRLAIDASLMKSGSSDSLSLTPFGAFEGDGDGVSTISSNCFIASGGLSVKFELAR